MVLNTSKYNLVTPLHFKGLTTQLLWRCDDD